MVFVTITLPSATYSISILEFQSTPIIMDTFEAKGNTKMTIKTSLGQSNALGIILIYSKRKLTVNEIEKIVDDLSNDKDENELIKGKICYIMREI
jgi:hypothetical protein